jgi:3-hydroxyacyl-[acyl-carrier-protein] dehydratase
VTDAIALPLGRAGIEAIIPHREPFLLVDEILELTPGERAVGRYHVAEDAWYLRGHFPGRPIMPGVLQVEALAQVGAVCGLSHPDFQGKLALFAGIDGVRFKRIVTPGDVLTLECSITRLRGPIGKADATASVDGDLCCNAALTFALTELSG